MQSTSPELTNMLQPAHSIKRHKRFGPPVHFQAAIAVLRVRGDWWNHALQAGSALAGRMGAADEAGVRASVRVRSRQHGGVQMRIVTGTAAAGLSVQLEHAGRAPTQQSGSVILDVPASERTKAIQQ